MRLIFVLICFSNFLVGQKIEKAQLSEGIVAYYPFDGDVKDYSGNCLHGNNYGADFTENRFGESETAIEFNGFSDYVEVEHSELFNFESGDDFAVSFWVKLLENQTDADTSDNDIISKWVANNESFEHMTSGYPFTFRVHNNKRQKNNNRIYAAQFSGYKKSCNGKVDLQIKSI